MNELLKMQTIIYLCVFAFYWKKNNNEWEWEIGRRELNLYEKIIMIAIYNHHHHHNNDKNASSTILFHEWIQENK